MTDPSPRGETWVCRANPAVYGVCTSPIGAIPGHNGCGPVPSRALHPVQLQHIKRLTEIHAEIEAWGYLHPNNRPARADRGEPTP